MKYWLVLLMFVVMPFCYAIEKDITATLSTIEKDSLEFGSTYNFILTIYPLELDELKKEFLEPEDVIPFLHMAEIGDIERSENNYDAVVVKIKGIITSLYKTDRRYGIKLGEMTIPLVLEIPSHGTPPKDLKDFTILGHEKPSEPFDYVIIVVLLGIISLFYFIYWFSKKNKKRSLYDDICDNIEKYTENRQLEYLYERRNEIINANSDSKGFFEKIGALQYRKGWSELDKTELNIEKKKVIEGLNGTR